MKTILWLASLMLASAAARAQLVKTLFQTFELPDSATAIVLDIYEEDAYEVVPWAGNTVMTESNIKMYYASRGVFDHLLEKGRYNFNSREGGDSLILSSTPERQLKVKLNTGEEEASEQVPRGRYNPRGSKQEKYEIVKIRIFIPDGFSAASANTWKRPRPERGEERIGAYRPRKKLARESGAVSDELREAVPEAPKDTVEEKIILPLPDSTWRRRPGVPDPTNSGKQ
ncbi:MAG: hypothetical protein J5I98_06810 [Phaeodactylibacter sp.]|nr:hypothetical protein [Phaeodactylibacter sp.]